MPESAQRSHFGPPPHTTYHSVINPVEVQVVSSVVSRRGLRVCSAQRRSRGQAGFSCSNGADLGANTLDQALLLPRVHAGLAAGGTAASFALFFNGIDKNGDGLICVKTTPAGNGNGSVNWQYNYNWTDNNSAANTE